MRNFYEIEEKAASSQNQYLLALAAARRVRHLKSGAPSVLTGKKPEKLIEIALEELAADHLVYSSQNAEEQA